MLMAKPTLEQMGHQYDRSALRTRTHPSVSSTASPTTTASLGRSGGMNASLKGHVQGKRRLIEASKNVADGLSTPPNSVPSSPVPVSDAGSAVPPEEACLAALELTASQGHLGTSDLAQLSAVCQRWHDRLVSQTRLWCHVVIPMHLSARVDNATVALLLARSNNRPIEVDLRGCHRVTTVALAAIEGCQSLRRLDIRGTQATPSVSWLRSLSPMVSAVQAGGSALPLRRLSALHLASCAERWHGVVTSRDQWQQLLQRLSGSKVASAAMAATASAVDFDTEMIVFASQLGSFAGSMWPKPQPRIVAAVSVGTQHNNATNDHADADAETMTPTSESDGDSEGSRTVLVHVTVPAVVENAGWFDAVVVPRPLPPVACAGSKPDSRHGRGCTVSWYFDTTSAPSDRAMDFEPIPSLPIAGTTTTTTSTQGGDTAAALHAVCCIRDPAAQLDAFLDYAVTAGHSRSLRHLMTSLSRGRVKLDDLAVSLPARVRAQLARELHFRTGCSTPSGAPTTCRRRAGADAATASDTPPRSPDDAPETSSNTTRAAPTKEENGNSSNTCWNVTLEDPIDDEQDDGGHNTGDGAAADKASPATTTATPASSLVATTASAGPSAGAGAAAGTAAHPAQSSPLSRTSIAATSFVPFPVDHDLLKFLSNNNDNDNESLTLPVEVDTLLAYSGQYFAESLTTSARLQPATPTRTTTILNDNVDVDVNGTALKKAMAIESSALPTPLTSPQARGSIKRSASSQWSPIASVEKQGSGSAASMTSDDQGQGQGQVKRWRLLGEAPVPSKVPRKLAFKTTRLSSVAIIGGESPCCRGR
eukprot:m.170623 g.170623  ORF g.170623 m.170623 type:complete len:819 (-) comp13267_c0_seq1:173-2629(-)